MKCPACATEMVVIEFPVEGSRNEPLEIDRCPGCGGIALDKGEAEAIDALDLAPVIESGAPAAHADRATPAHCYECDQQMIALKGAGDVEYDWCEGCERLFFDRGELTALDAFVDA